MRQALDPRRGLWLAAALCIWLLALVASQRIPPMQSPDEPSHIARAYLLCNGAWLLNTPPGESSGGAVDRALDELVQPYLRLARDSALRLRADESQAVAALRWSGDEAFLPIPSTGYLLPFINLPQAAGPCLWRALELPVQASYRLARALTLTVSLLWLLAAVRLHNPGPLTLLLLCLPMSLFQWLSPTVDGLSHAMTVWLASAFVRLHSGDAGSSATLRLGWVAVIAVLAGSRTHLLPAFLLPLALCLRRRDAPLAVAAVAALAAVLAWYAWVATHLVDGRIVRSAGLPEIIGHYAARPAELLAVVHATLGDAQTRLFYGRSFIGILGWLDTMLPLWAYPALGAMLAATAVLSALRGTVGAAAPWLLAAAVASVPLVFAALLVGWSEFPATRIEGVQGRYFIAPALLAAAALAAPRRSERSPPAWRRAAGVASGVVALAGAALGVYAFWVTLALRYH
jgi:hypothetical protein